MSVRNLRVKLESSPILCAAVYLLIWQGITALMWLFTARLWVLYLPFILSFTLIYPIITCWTGFRYTRLFGVKWYLTFVMIGVSVAEYVFISDATAVVPNFILLTVLCVLFSVGIGSVFAVPQEKKKSGNNKKEERYKKILDD